VYTILFYALNSHKNHDIFHKYHKLTFVNNLEARVIPLWLQLGQEMRINIRKPLQVYVRFVHMATEICAHILCVFEGILNKAGGIH